MGPLKIDNIDSRACMHILPLFHVFKAHFQYYSVPVGRNLDIISSYISSLICLRGKNRKGTIFLKVWNVNVK